jgi:hypothetical protein
MQRVLAALPPPAILALERHPVPFVASVRRGCATSFFGVASDRGRARTLRRNSEVYR